MNHVALKDKVAVVTGGAQGVGLATARRLLEAGARVAVWERDAELLSRALNELGPGAAVLDCVCDVTNQSHIQLAAQRTKAELGPVDILVNNAGFVRGGAFLERPLADWDTTVAVNLSGVVAVTYALLPGMYERGFGRVVNISSASGTLGVSDLAVYAASKWAVWGLTESLRHEALNSGLDIRFSSVHPSYIKTGMFEGARIRGLGGFIVPLVASHDIIAQAIVQDAVIKGKAVVMRPRSVRAAVLLRGILPSALFDRVVRLLGIHRSMQGFVGRSS